MSFKKCFTFDDVLLVPQYSSVLPREVKLRLNPWITPEILKLIRIRDRLFARKKREPENSEANLSQHVEEILF